jgi:hypothetical protein
MPDTHAFLRADPGETGSHPPEQQQSCRKCRAIYRLAVPTWPAKSKRYRLFRYASTAARTKCIIYPHLCGAIHAGHTCCRHRLGPGRDNRGSAPRAELLARQRVFTALRADPPGAQETGEPRADPLAAPIRRRRGNHRRWRRYGLRRRCGHRRRWELGDRHWNGRGSTITLRVVPGPCLRSGQQIALDRTDGIPEPLRPLGRGHGQRRGLPAEPLNCLFNLLDRRIRGNVQIRVPVLLLPHKTNGTARCARFGH